MQQSRVQVRDVMQGRRAEDQIEPSTVRKGHQVPRKISKMRPGSLAAGGVDQRLTDVDADDVVKTVREHLRVTACSTTGIQSPAAMGGQLREQPVQDPLRLHTSEP